MGKVLSLALALVLALTACGAKPAPEGETAQVANPYVTYDTVEDAAQAVGFTLGLPDNVDWADEVVYQVVANAMLQATYRSEDRELVLRKALGSDDISGDYSSYTYVRQEEIGGMPVTCKGSEELVYTAVWAEDGYTFSLSDSLGMDLETLASSLSRIA